jgi:anti-sigma B factor antagonist
MNCEIREEGGVSVVALSGDVDLESSPTVRTALLDCVGKQQAVVVDLSGVSRKSETSFALADVSQAAMRVLELARLDKVFTIHDSLVDGLKHGG